MCKSRPTHRLLLLTVFCIVAQALAGAGETPEPAVSLTCTLSAKTITQNEQLRFTLTVENKSSGTLTNLRLLQAPDGYQWLRIHAQGTKGIDADYDSAAKFAQANDVLFPSVPPGATYTAWGYLRPLVAHKVATLTAQVAWNTSAQKNGERPISSSVELGENTVQGEGDILWGYVTILALPLVLALLPFIVGSMLKRRDERSETQRLMLTQALEYAAKYYLPLSAAAQRLVEVLQPRAVGGQAQPRNALACFYYVVYLEKRMTEQRKAVGGFYFKDLRPEMLASQCWKEYSDVIFGTDPTDEFNRCTQACVNKLKDRENFDAFAKRLEMNQPGVFANPDAQRAWTLFQTKLNAIAIDQLVLDLNTLQALIDYEVNRPLENWYPTSLPPLQVDRAVKARLLQLAEKRGFTPEEKEYVEAAEVPPTEA